MGKSRVAVDVARRSRGEIVSADSMQIYRGLPILTDQPSREMLDAVPHHFVGVVPVSEEYSAARYSREAREVITEIDARGALPLLVGGTGLYVRALMGGLTFTAGSDAALRQKWEDFIRNEGTGAAYRELSRMDPAAAGVIDRDNPRRLVRALEAAESGRGSLARERFRLWSAESPYRGMSFGLEMPRADLYRKIDERVDAMLKGGAVQEVEKALREGVSRTAAQAIGFGEIEDYLAGRLTLDEAAHVISQKSRRYAKRQLTWMRKMPDIVRIDMAGRTAAEAADLILGRITRQALL